MRCPLLPHCVHLIGHFVIGHFMKQFFGIIHLQYEDKCTPVTEQQCNVQQKEECTTVQEDQCSTQYEVQNDRQCQTVTKNVCDFVKDRVCKQVSILQLQFENFTCM
jgi:hypothetical protein